MLIILLLSGWRRGHGKWTVIRKVDLLPLFFECLTFLNEVLGCLRSAIDWQDTCSIYSQENGN